MSQIFTDEEKTFIRAHLGYQQGQLTYTFALGVPAGVQSQFPIEVAMDKLLPAAAPLARRYLEILDRIEMQGVDDYELMSVSKIDEIEVNKDEHRQLWGNDGYMRWRAALANLFGIIPNPYDLRFPNGSAGGSINARRVHG
jgi:hypothetical protein